MSVLVTRSSMPPMQEYIDEISSIWDSHWLTNMGEKHKELQKRLRDKLEVENIELFTNGHMAIEMALQSLELTGEVITTPYTFVSTTHAIVRNNLTPVFCDVNPDDCTIDVNKIEQLITDKTTAIMPVHVYGNICDVDSIQEIADRHGLKVIYDAAHAFAEKKDGVSVGRFGDVSCFSFHATKVFNTIEGGAACYKDPKVGEKLYQLKNFGIKNEETINGIGANAKMNEFCAAMGICNLRHLDDEIKKRKLVYERYVERLAKIKGIRLINQSSKVDFNYAYFPIFVDAEKYGHDRNELYEVLMQHDIISRKYFYPITNACDCYSGRFNPNDTPIALRLSNEVITLPLYADLDDDIVEMICNIIQSYSV